MVAAALALTLKRPSSHSENAVSCGRLAAMSAALAAMCADMRKLSYLCNHSLSVGPLPCQPSITYPEHSNSKSRLTGRLRWLAIPESNRAAVAGTAPGGRQPPQIHTLPCRKQAM